VCEITPKTTKRNSRIFFVMATILIQFARSGLLLIRMDFVS